MLTVLFWNMGGNPNQAALGAIVQRYPIDLLLLAECPLSPPDLLACLNASGGNVFHPPDPASNCPAILVIPRFEPRFVLVEAESHRYTARHLVLPGRPELLFIAVHLPSKLYQSAESQALDLPRLADLIREVEKKVGHDRTFLVGDFNMNPFEAGMAGAQGLNAVMTREIALRGERVVHGATYPFLYNPMWGQFGDASHEIDGPGSETHRPPGTCYFGARESLWFYWNVYDQVLLRPSLLPYFHNQTLKVLSHDGRRSLVTARGLPDRNVGSDHLPIMFSLHC